MSVSIFASAVRPKMWDACLSSFQDTSCDFEVIFVGHCTKEEVKPFTDKYPFFKYIHTEYIKPSQCYQIGLNYSTKETVLWFCDDGEMINDIVGKAYKYWKSQKNEKLILSIQTREFYLSSGDGFCDMKKHAFYGGKTNSPLMAPLGLLSRKVLNDLGGIDRRYISGQYENQAVMMILAQGGHVEIFGDRHSYIEIDHINKSKKCGESTTHQEFLNRPFARSYQHDRKILESVCSYEGKNIKIESFEPFEDKDILTKSQSYKGEWN